MTRSGRLTGWIERSHSHKIMFPFRRFLTGSLALGLAWGVGLFSGCATHSQPSRVQIFETNQVVRVELDGKLFTEYHYRDVSRPYLYPILNADGQHMTRRWPQETVENEEQDHPHHHGLWWAHGDANGVDFWSEAKGAGRTVHQAFHAMKSGHDQGVITSRNEWVAKDGKVVATDERTLRFHAPQGENRIIDFEITIHASHGDLVLGDTKEGTMAIRLAETMRLTQPKKVPGQGHILNSEGLKDGDTWGKRAGWVDYTGPVAGKTVGVAIFDAPQNPRYPTWWHVRDYGLFAANPFGLHDFEKKPKGTGNMTLPAGKSLTFRYRFLFHPDSTSPSQVAEQFQKWIHSGPR